MIGIAGQEARRFTDSTKRTGSDCKSKLLGRLICRRGELYIAALGHTILFASKPALEAGFGRSLRCEVTLVTSLFLGDGVEGAAHQWGRVPHTSRSLRMCGSLTKKMCGLAGPPLDFDLLKITMNRMPHSSRFSTGVH